MERKIIETPSSILIRMQVVHFGKILFNLEVVALLIVLSSILTFLSAVVYYTFLLFITVGTFGLIYALYPTFSTWWSGGETLLNVSVYLSENWKYTIPLVFVLSVASAICLGFEKGNKQVVKIAISMIIALFALVIFIFKWTRGETL